MLVALVAAGSIWWAVATESGTRWLLGQALDRAPAGLEVREVSGTLWHGLRLGRVGYTQFYREIDRYETLHIPKVEIIDRVPPQVHPRPFQCGPVPHVRIHPVRYLGSAKL